MQLIIFDCDGVLVDSETISNAVFCDMLAEFGVVIPYEECFERFTGLSLKSCLELLGKEFNKALPTAFANQYKEKVLEKFKLGLKPVKGIHKALENIQQPVCVASGSNHERIKLSLELTGLTSIFGNHIFSASDVSQGKPAPDLFLYAAKKMGVAAKDCVVIEDSLPGIQAGLAAKMKVFAYVGSLNVQTLSKTGAHCIFHDMLALPNLLKTTCLK